MSSSATDTDPEHKSSWVMIELSEIRHEAGVTQAEMAARLSTTQGSVSQLERRGDVLLSTLSEYLTALGAQPASP